MVADLLGKPVLQEIHVAGAKDDPAVAVAAGHGVAAAAGGAEPQPAAAAAADVVVVVVLYCRHFVAVFLTTPYNDFEPFILNLFRLFLKRTVPTFL